MTGIETIPALVAVQGAGGAGAPTMGASGSWLLPALVIVPLVSAAVVALGSARQAARTAMLGTLVAAGLGLIAMLSFNWEYLGAGMQLGARIEWAPELGLALSFGVDGVSMVLVLLTLLLGPICVACSFSAVRERVKTYYAWLLVLQAAMTGVFVARDLIFFYVCFEFTLVPMYVLISLYGSTNRKRAATKFFLYTFTGSLIALAGLVYVAWWVAQPGRNGLWTFDIGTLTAWVNGINPAGGPGGNGMPLNQQAWVLAAMLAGFAVKVPLFPFHTWLPLAHTEAPTAGSVILAGVLLKLGTYGIFRFAIPMAPGAAAAHAPLLAGLCVVGILYGGLICWVQTDVKKLVAYSSVAHLGFCVLGMVALNGPGLTGAVLYMINHGLSTGALFLLIGMIYERYHTRSMKELGGLAARMPIWATFMVFFVMASVGLPGLNGFVGEFLCLMGAFQADGRWGAATNAVWGSAGAVPGATSGSLGPWIALLAGLGMIVAAIYLLYMLGRVVFGRLIEPPGHGDHAEHADHGDQSTHGDHGADHGHEPDRLPPDLTRREIAVLTPLALLCFVLGVYPAPLLDAVRGPVGAVVDAVEKARERDPELRPDVRVRRGSAPQTPAPDGATPPSDALPPDMRPENPAAPGARVNPDPAGAGAHP